MTHSFIVIQVDGIKINFILSNTFCQVLQMWNKGKYENTIRIIGFDSGQLQ